MRTSTISAAGTGARRRLHFAQALEQHLPGARQHAHGELRGEDAAAHALGLRERDVVGDGGHDFDAGDEMGELGEIGEHHRRIGADVVLLAQFLQRGGDVAFHQRFEQVDHPHAVGEAEHLPHVFRAHGTCRVGNGLIEQRETIAHRAFRRARDQRQRRRLDFDHLFAGDTLEMFDQQRGIDAAQIEALAAREHRHRHLADFGGGEDELGVRRRLFQRLEQRVERGRAKACALRRGYRPCSAPTPARSGWRR